MSKLFAGLDVSTQSCKIVVIDFDKEDVVHVDLVSYDDDLPEYGTRHGVIQGLAEGVSESDPRMWLAAVDRVFERLCRSDVPQKDIRSISVSGQQHGLVALDRDGNPARTRSKLWNDYSTLEECRILTESVGGLEAMIEAVGNSQRTGYTAPKILHMLRHEAEVFDRTATLLLVHNYIDWYLTGGTAVMEPGDTSGTALWNPKTGQYSSVVLDAIHPGLINKIPNVAPSDVSIGRISPELAERFGFSVDCTIDAGSGDNMYSAVGTGNVEPGIVTVSLGTSGTAYTFMEEPFIDPVGEIAAFCDSTGHHLPLLCVSNLANGYDELLRQFELNHEQFDEIIGRTPPGNDGHMLIPWYSGERTPDLPQASPLYFGFPLGGFGRDRLCRAVLEGHVLNLYTGFKRMPTEVNEIRLTGGLSRSAAWCQMIADVFDVEAVPVEGEGAALGAALHAAWVWHKEFQTEMTLKRIVESFVELDEGRRRTPESRSRAVYQHQRWLFEALSRRVRGLKAEDPFRLRAEMMELSTELGRRQR
jgi:xylulokinase